MSELKYSQSVREMFRRKLENGAQWHDFEAECLLEEIDRLTSLVQRMAEIGDELTGNYISDFRRDDMTNYYCEECSPFKNTGIHNWQDFVHAPACPVTKWQELRKEIEE